MWKPICLFLMSFSLAASAAETSSSTDRFWASPLHAGLDIQYVPVQYKDYVWTGNERSMKNGHGLHIALEWIPFDERYGKLGIGAGTGFYVIKNANFGGTNATLSTIPIEGFLSYRLDYFHKQIIVPYGKIGLSHTVAIQKGIEAPTRGMNGFDKVLGVEFNLGVIDSKSAKQWDRNSGVNNTYLLVEWSKTDPLGDNRTPNLSSELIRVGLRIEM